MYNHFSRQVNTFHGRAMPESGHLIGYALLIDYISYRSSVAVPLPHQLAMATDKFQRYDKGLWRVFTKRHRPGPHLQDHLTFALKHEPLDLYVLKAFFLTSGEEVILNMLVAQPTGRYARKAWFLFEWLLQTKIDWPDLKRGTYVDVLNSKLQFVGPSVPSSRHRIRNNLPGTPQFCPLVRKTGTLAAFTTEKMQVSVGEGAQRGYQQFVRRVSAFMLLKDSKASFDIEGDTPPQRKATDWAQEIGKAGSDPLTIPEINRLQQLVLGPKKLKHMGVRQEEGFIGEHDRDSFEPVPEHISARAIDLPSLLQGLLETNQLLEDSDYDAVLAAATVGFGFVFIHPLADGNGRIHRYIIHHVLARKHFTDSKIIFPISAVMLDRINDYREALQQYSRPRLKCIQWKSSRDRNIEIINDTADLYRFYDLTPQAEFLYECVKETIANIIPREIQYLRNYDILTKLLHEIISLPDTKLDLLIKMLHQNNGRLSRRKWQRHFSELSEDDVGSVEEAYSEVF